MDFIYWAKEKLKSQQDYRPAVDARGPTDIHDQVMAQDEQQHRSTVNSNVDDQALKCPRCDSPNTKFCYYNNYNLTQPRHFCKTCRRYWTKGGALRNVPIGGGCRKNNPISMQGQARRWMYLRYKRS